MQCGQPTRHANHHVVSITGNEASYYAVLLEEFLEQAPQDVGNHLREWYLADTLRAHPIAVVSGDGVSPV
ncbi:MAG: hypothetical protein ACHQ9S_03760 [Candidatus Binatia bacterium]